MYIVSVLMNAVQFYLGVLEIALLVRVAYPLLFASEEGLAFSFIFATTEPVMIPFRSLLEKSETFQNMPVDFSVVFAAFAVTAVRFLLILIY